MAGITNKVKAVETNNPKMIPFTARDWIIRASYRKKCYEFIGINKKNKVAILLPFGPWIAGPLAQSALIQLGCTVFPIGLLSEENEINGLFSIVQKHNIDTIVSTPSFMQNMLKLYSLQKNKINFKKIIVSGEHISNTLRKKISQAFKAKVYSSYATSESFIGIECSEHDGFHYDPKELNIEIVDKNTYLPTKNTGLILISVLNSEAVPLLRYCLCDMGTIKHTKCSCGSCLPKVILKGREQETFVVAGAVNVYSYQIRNFLSMINLPINRCQIEIFDNEFGKDLVVFNLYTNVTLKPGNNIKKNIKKLLDNISMDFNDVIFYKIVSTKINIKQEKYLGGNIKSKPIEIIDKRKYAR